MTKDDANAINRVMGEVYTTALEHGFHDDDAFTVLPDEVHGEVSVGRMAAFCANLHGEASELWEATRHGTLRHPSDKGIPLTFAEEELADIVIRAMDTAYTMGIDLGKAIQVKAEFNQSRPFMHGKKA